MVENATISIPKNINYFIDITEKEKSISNNFSIESPKITYNRLSVINNCIQDILNKMNISFKYVNTNTSCIGGEMVKKYLKSVTKIQYNNHIYEFDINFIYTIYLCDGIFVAENEFFNLIGYGDTIQEAEQDLYNTLDELWNIYVLEDDNKLDNSAKQIKQLLQKNIIRK